MICLIGKPEIFMKHVVHLVYSHIPLVPFIQRKVRSSHRLVTQQRETIPTSVGLLHIGRVPWNSLLLHIGLMGAVPRYALISYRYQLQRYICRPSITSPASGAIPA